MKLPADTGPSLDRDRISTTSNADVAFGGKADMTFCTAYLRMKWKKSRARSA